MGQGNCALYSNRMSFELKQEQLERKNKMSELKKIKPKTFDEDSPEYEDLNEEEGKSSPTKIKSLKSGGKASTKKLRSTKGIPAESLSSFLKEDEIHFEEDSKYPQKEEEIQMKKVKVKWNEFIKMKKKKFTEDYTIIREIGRGGFGCVYKVMMKNGKIARAAKKIDKSQLNDEEHDNLLGEMSIMMSLDHPNIVKLFEVYDQKNYYVMVMELCDGGELFHRIVNFKMSEGQIIDFTKQMLNAVFYMHTRGIIHRDIKPENMLIEKKTKLLKIIDFGISTKIQHHEVLTSRVGTPYYIAPEVLCKRYNEKADMWSIGIVVYMMLTGAPPFKGKDPAEVMEKVLHDIPHFVVGKAWKKYSPTCIEFTRKLLTKNLRERLSAKKALSHPWLTNAVVEQSRASEADKEEVYERLKKFRFKNKLQAVVYTYIVSQLLTSTEKEDLLEYFQEIDKNKNGVIEVEQLRESLKNKSETVNKTINAKYKEILDYIDTNCSGQIDYTQFVVAAIDFNKKVTKEHFEQAFQYFDIDNSGAITFSEVSQFLDEENNHAIQQMFKLVDENGDGLISKQEFVELLMKKH